MSSNAVISGAIKDYMKMQADRHPDARYRGLFDRLTELYDLTADTMIEAMVAGRMLITESEASAEFAAVRYKAATCDWDLHHATTELAQQWPIYKPVADWAQSIFYARRYFELKAAGKL